MVIDPGGRTLLQPVPGGADEDGRAGFARAVPVAAGWILAAALAAVSPASATEALRGSDYGPAGSACAYPGPDQEQLVRFLKDGCYRNWAHDPELRSTGPLFVAPGGGQLDESTHMRIIVFYSSAVVDWLRAGRPQTGIDDDAMVVKEMYAPDPDGGSGDIVQGYATMLKRKDRSWDGWFWSLYFNRPNAILPNTGEFGFSFCMTCHGMADNRETIFASLLHLDGRVIEKPVLKPVPGSRAKPPRSHAIRPRVKTGGENFPSPLAREDDDFLAVFAKYLAGEDALKKSKETGREVVSHLDAKAAAFPPADQSKAVSGAHGPDTFLTSDQCVGCHGATLLFDEGTPVKQNMVATDEDGKPVDLSPYGEWSVSVMGLAGRDPVFHAQLESEKALRPEMRGFLDDTCYKCHGVMGLRQLHADQDGRAFQHAMIYARDGDPNAKYGALARDGISCTVCHRITPDNLGTPASFTASFETGRSDEIYGPFSDVITKPMENTLGITPKPAEHLRRSELCGSCHVVVLPRLKLGEDYAGTDPFNDKTVALVHEQTTYLEWLNSGYAGDDGTRRTCQNCHMPTQYGDSEALSFKIANILDDTFRQSVKETAGYEVLNMLPPEQSTMTERKPFARHTLLGINLFVMEMFRQFSDLLGITPNGEFVQQDMVKRARFAQEAANLLAKTATATVEIVDLGRQSGDLVAHVRIANKAGHKFPSGVGFRRAFLRFRVLNEDGGVIWASGETSSTGVILYGTTGTALASEFSKTEVQPHYRTITRQDQAQIYEERHKNDLGELTTSFLGLLDLVKDNRLLPLGWKAFPGERPDEADNNARIIYDARDDMKPHGTADDPDYGADAAMGADNIVYRVPLSAIAGAARVTVDLFYQSVPPYYLRDRFEIAKGPETRRLFYIASHLDLAGTPIENWRLHIGGASSRLAP